MTGEVVLGVWLTGVIMVTVFAVIFSWAGYLDRRYEDRNHLHKRPMTDREEARLMIKWWGICLLLILGSWVSFVGFALLVIAVTSVAVYDVIRRAL